METKSRPIIYSEPQDSPGAQGRRIPMHGQFLLVQLESPDEAVLGRIASFSSEGKLAFGSGEEFNIRAMRDGRAVPEDLREQYLKYKVNIRVLGVLRQDADAGLVFVPSHRRLPHVGSPVAFPSGAALPFADDSLDVVLCLDTLEHLTPADRRAVVQSLRRARDVAFSCDGNEGAQGLRVGGGQAGGLGLDHYLVSLYLDLGNFIGSPRANRAKCPALAGLHHEPDQ